MANIIYRTSKNGKVSLEAETNYIVRCEGQALPVSFKEPVAAVFDFGTKLVMYGGETETPLDTLDPKKTNHMPEGPQVYCAGFTPYDGKCSHYKATIKMATSPKNIGLKESCDIVVCTRARGNIIDCPSYRGTPEPVPTPPIIDATPLSGCWQNIKNKQLYKVLGLAFNCTNSQDDQIMIRYCAHTDIIPSAHEYVREKQEFLEKFTFISNE